MLNDIRDRLVPNDIPDRLDLEIDCFHGLVSAIGGLECLDEERHNGVIVLAGEHIKRLGEISAELWRFAGYTG